MVSSMDLPQSHVGPSSFICEGCLEGKLQLSPFLVHGTTYATKTLEIVHYVKEKITGI